MGAEIKRVMLRSGQVFEPLLAPARYKGAWGGRGSGKSHFFAGMAVEKHANNPGTHTVCIREIQQSLRVCPKTSGGITKFSEHEVD